MRTLLTITLLLTLSATARAQAELTDLIPPATAPTERLEPQVSPPYAHPTLPAEAAWPGATVILILAMFVAAAAVGVVVRLDAPQEVPTAHSHDEPPGASHHHGPGGTVQPGPEHDLPGGHVHH
jgi:hypothetical protein